MHTYLKDVAHIAAATAVFAVVLAVAGCSSNQSAPAIITGAVLHDGNHGPLKDAEAQVTANRKIVTPARDGTFELVLSNTDATTVYAIADGYEVGEKLAPAGAGYKDIGAFYMKPVIIAGYGKVTGIVTDPGTGAVEGALVWVGGNTAVTDADGRYVLYNVAAGRHTVTASTGTKYGTASVNVITLRESTADIGLTSNPPIGPFAY